LRRKKGRKRNEYLLYLGFVNPVGTADGLFR